MHDINNWRKCLQIQVIYIQINFNSRLRSLHLNQACERVFSMTFFRGIAKNVSGYGKS